MFEKYSGGKSVKMRRRKRKEGRETEPPRYESLKEVVLILNR